MGRNHDRMMRRRQAGRKCVGREGGRPSRGTSRGNTPGGRCRHRCRDGSRGGRCGRRYRRHPRFPGMPFKKLGGRTRQCDSRSGGTVRAPLGGCWRLVRIKLSFQRPSNGLLFAILHCMTFLWPHNRSRCEVLPALAIFAEHALLRLRAETSANSGRGFCASRGSMRWKAVQSRSRQRRPSQSRSWRLRSS